MSSQAVTHFAAVDEIVEQDDRRIKVRTSAMLGFKSFHNAQHVLAGLELIHKLKKGQYGVPARFGVFSLDIWRNVLAALFLVATEPSRRCYLLLQTLKGGFRERSRSWYPTIQ